MQASELEVFQTRAQIETEQVAQAHGKVGVAMRVDSELLELHRGGLPHHPLERRPGLPLAEHQRLVIDDAPLVQHMRVHAHGMATAPWVNSRAPQMP